MKRIILIILLALPLSVKSAPPATSARPLNVDANGNVLPAVDQVWSKSQTIDTGANGDTLHEGLVLRNDTAADSGHPLQDSPAILFEAHGWQDLFSSDIEFEMTEEFHVLPDESPPVARFSWKFSENEGPYVEKSYLGSDGSIFGHGYIKTETGFMAVDGSGNAGGLNATLLYWTDTVSQVRIANQGITFPLQIFSYNTTVPAFDFYSNGVSLPTGDQIRIIRNSGGATANYLNLGVTSDGTQTVSSVYKIDASGNQTGGTTISYTTTATAAGTTTLTVASTRDQRFTGSTTQTVALPVTSTLSLGHNYRIINDSTGNVTVNSSGGNAVIALGGGTSAIVTCILTAGTNASSWSAGLNYQTAIPVEIGVALSDETTELTDGGPKVTLRAPYAFTITAVRSSLTTSSSSGFVRVDINENGTTILSTKLTIDESETTSTTAAAPAVISDASIANDSEITFDIDDSGTGAAGLKVWIIGHR